MRYVYLKYMWFHLKRFISLVTRYQADAIIFSSVLASRKHFTIQVHFEDSGIGQETLPGSLCK